ncbi:MULTISPECIES: contractile injection system protein, VgrG/Pvc8 family [Citrobacter]|uniref:contractile injection system protein, VgrG/Pvc8 family n=1 Tax=Citrobacter TaxID=544 RepID=UPI00254A8823|nr:MULTISPECIES: contractile injection system protein, VgrG/Pvc8 family [Citrobacter]MDM3157327.1 contractile injection system protein, VgrG/Pvc8 family [Citrobacter sp. Cf122]
MANQITSPEYGPAFSIKAEGKDITRTLQQCLSELILTDYGGAMAKADELKITLISETLALPSKGARLQVALGFNDQLVDKGWFVVSGVASSGPPRRIEIYATAAPMNAQKQPGDVTSQKTRSWDNLRLEDLVKTVAVDNGLIPRVADVLKDIHISHVDQVAESDANLLSRLARTYNAVSKPSGGYWLFLQQGATATASGKQTRRITITPEDVSEWSYSEGQRGSSTGKATGREGKSKEKIGVRYYDEMDGKTKTASVGHDGPAMTNPYTQSEKNTAEQQAKARKTLAKRNEQKMTVTGPCRPKHVLLTAESGVTTSGFGSREDRTWVVESLAFSLTPSGFSYTYNLVVDVRKPVTSFKKSEKQDKTGPAYFG